MNINIQFTRAFLMAALSVLLAGLLMISTSSVCVLAAETEIVDLTEPTGDAIVSTEAVETLSTLTPEHLEPIYETLQTIATVDLVLLCAVGLVAGAAIGAALWRWFN